MLYAGLYNSARTLPPAMPVLSARTHSLKLHASDAERRTIEARAEREGLSVSAYLRAAALGRGIRFRGAADIVDALCDLEAQLSALPTLPGVDAIRQRLTDLAAAL